jgi:hypothetical protein
LNMPNIARISSTGALLKKAASLAVSRSFPAWIDAAEYGVTPATVVPRVRDSLVLRLVAGRRQTREQTLIHASGAH